MRQKDTARVDRWLILAHSLADDVVDVNSSLQQPAPLDKCLNVADRQPINDGGLTGFGLSAIGRPQTHSWRCKCCRL